MILTEKEAQTKFCFRTFPNNLMFAGGEARGQSLPPTNCDASDCMAWRWAFDATGHFSMKSVAPASECAACSGKGAMPNDEGELGTCPECSGEGKRGHYERVGFCGLAGRPE